MSSEDQLYLIEQLANEFFARNENGDSISVSDFAVQHPAQADELRDFIEGLQLVRGINNAAKPTKPPSPARGIAEIPDYRIIREIGRGAMGVVYEAEQISLARRVALKTTLFSVAGDDTQRLRFQHEARTASRLHHPNIVPIYDVGEAEDSLYYAMQFIDGCGLDRIACESANILRSPETQHASKEGSLASWLISSEQGSSGTTRIRQDGTTKVVATDAPTTAGSLSQIFSAKSDPGLIHERSRYRNYYRSIASIGQHVAEALSYAHDSQVIHRDIKPANLLLDTKGKVWVADFGLVKTEDHGLTQTGAFVGTLRFMAPERFQGKCDARSDVYSLGVTLYELLALRPIYDSADQLSLLKQIRDVEPPSLRAIKSSVPRDLDVIVARAMHKDPQLRYASARDLADDLQCFLDGRPIQARQVSSAEKLLLWAKKHKALAASLAMILTLLVVGAFAGTFAAIYFRQQGIKQSQLATQNLELAAQKEAESREAIKQRDAARQSEYFADMRSANQSWEDGQVHRMLSTLRKYVPADGKQDLRGWEWYRLISLTNQDERTIIEHVFKVEWTANAQVVAATRNGKLQIRDQAGNLEREWDIPGIRGFSLSPSNDRVATIGDDSVIRIWDLESSAVSKEIDTQTDSICGVDWSPVGERIAIACEDEARIQILDLRTNELASVETPWEPRDFTARSVRFSRDGKLLAVCGTDKPAEILQVARRTWMKRSDHWGYHALCFAWHPTRRQFVEGNRDEGLLVFDFEAADLSAENGELNDKPLANLDEHKTFSAVSYSSTGDEALVCGPSQQVEIYDLRNFKVARTFKGHVGATVDAARHPSNPQIVSCALDGTVKFWDSTTPYAYTAAVATRKSIANSSGISRDGRWKYQRVTTEATNVTGVVTERQADKLMTIRVADAKTGAEIGQTEGFYYQSLYTPVFFSSGNRMLVTQAHHPYPDAESLESNPLNHGIAWAGIWSLDPWKQLETSRPSEWSSGIPNYSLHGSLFVTTDESLGTLRILDFEKNIDKRIQAHDHRFCLSMSPDGSRLATCGQGEIKIWDTTTWKEIAAYSGHSRDSPIFSVMWTRDGRYLVTGDSTTMAIVWDTKLHKRLHSLRGHQSAVQLLGFSADESRLITASQNIHVWHMESGREILAYPRANQDNSITELHIANERIAKMADPQLQFDALDRANTVDDNN